MITSFFQVALQCFNRLLSDDRNVVPLGIPAIAIMLSTGMPETLRISCFAFLDCEPQGI